ncbi:MAG: hypothetical protein ACOYNI_11860 [Acidimicrobiia bacterium]
MPDALDALPEHLKQRKTADAVMSPGAILLGGVGASAAVLIGAPLLLAVPVGALVYGGIVALRLPKKPKGPRIEPRALPTPWSEFVSDALGAQRRYRKALGTVEAGPLRDRLAEIGVSVDSGVEQCWRVAKRGAQLDDALRTLDGPGIARDRAELEGSSWADTDARQRAEESIAAREATYQRLSTVAADARDRVRALNARLDEAVARAIELSLRTEDVNALGGLGGDVDSVVSDMEALRQALEEASGTPAVGNGGATQQG